MRTTKIVGIVMLAGIVMGLSNAGWAQSAKGQRCVRPVVRNAFEAVMIEAGSNKDVCWVRDGSGKLVAVGPNPPNVYKPILRATPAPVPSQSRGVSNSRTAAPVSRPPAKTVPRPSPRTVAAPGTGSRVGAFIRLPNGAWVPVDHPLAAQAKRRGGL